MDGTFVNALAALVRQPQVVEFDGRQLVLDAQGNLHHVPRYTEAVPTALEFGTLEALAGYLSANRDELDPEVLTLHVQSPNRVRLLGPLYGDEDQRAVYALAVCPDLVGDWLGKEANQLDFNLGLITRFEDGRGDSKEALLALTMRLKEEQSVEHADDGRGQTVTARKGVHLAEQVTVPNPQLLHGYRTFREVPQVQAPYVLRVRGGNGLPPSLSLHETDGGAWKLAAVARVAAWLREHVASAVPVLA